jgi:hypothetical protein
MKYGCNSITVATVENCGQPNHDRDEIGSTADGDNHAQIRGGPYFCRGVNKGECAYVRVPTAATRLASSRDNMWTVFSLHV